ncbi:MAG: hypothetical protein NC402_08095 [Prevotella sp.]|nr:hypothetical protein [Prevotella sp.]MCM1075628.1 hypothetical protein [Ruminococcus sp.]
MSEVLKMTYEGVETQSDIKSLPTVLRTSAAEQKYAEAVAVYADTDFSIRMIAEKRLGDEIRCGYSRIRQHRRIAEKHSRTLRPCIHYYNGLHTPKLPPIASEPQKDSNRTTKHFSFELNNRDSFLN